MSNNETKTVELETPLQRGEDIIIEITLRKPNTGALRGLSLTNVLQVDVDSMLKLLPRITSPSLTIKEIEQLQPSDFTALAVEAVGFLVKKEDQANYLSE